jgi:hypothetical protein
LILLLPVLGTLVQLRSTHLAFSISMSHHLRKLVVSFCLLSGA